MFRKLVKYVFILACLIVFFYVNNNWLTVSNHTMQSPEIPTSFDGYRIVQVSDLHDATFGDKQQRLRHPVNLEPLIRFTISHSTKAFELVTQITPKKVDIFYPC